VGAPSASPAGTQQQSYHVSIPRQPGYYCSTFQPAISGTVTSTNTKLDDGYLVYFVCRDLRWGQWTWFESEANSIRVITPSRCLWAYNSINCPTPQAQLLSATFQCLPGCLVATPCVNGANGTYLATPSTFDGVTDITPNSCPIQCNPGFTLQDNYCVPKAPCASCGNDYSAPGAAVCKPCRVCPTGSYLVGCNESSEGTCETCTNTANV
jgi:hypothetical protein